MDAMLTRRMTADEYLALPEDGYPRTELIEGEVVVSQPKAPHQLVVQAVLRALEGWTLAADARGVVTLPLDVKVDERNVFGPDLLWYADGRALAHDAPYPLPQLAVEVRSPRTWRYDVGAKMLAYERAGLEELWLVDTVARTVIVCRRSGPGVPTFDVLREVTAGEALTSPQLPGFAIAAASLF
jgi:Uma2 family endonuclease